MGIRGPPSQYHIPTKNNFLTLEEIQLYIMRKRKYYSKNFQSNPQELDIKVTLSIEKFRGSGSRSGHIETIWQLIWFNSIIYCSIYNVQTFKIMSLMRHNIINQGRFEKPNEQNLFQRHCNRKFISNGHFVWLLLLGFPISNLIMEEA